MRDSGGLILSGWNFIITLVIITHKVIAFVFIPVDINFIPSFIPV
ncbi:hypothetical protein XBJ2_2300009 [Xenorhabdus bovienii str. Jollieti]|uniref:Uncharacterized protein n=1 Tax=Xenorhabdus bovienii (strain SS-2004) TaxID=406818 RepID=D3V352_XENBS|nr:hypothetical protein XBJ1_2041 [Xenorhabdus bovienii SS-2004]CDH29174.1 hypothetical protein XBJ2_2300009 [Xenorhabdus bovienii str. Jollieti]